MESEKFPFDFIGKIFALLVKPDVFRGALLSFSEVQMALFSAALVAGPTEPSTASPFLLWKLRTAVFVAGPKLPSIVKPAPV